VTGDRRYGTKVRRPGGMPPGPAGPPPAPRSPAAGVEVLDVPEAWQPPAPGERVVYEAPGGRSAGKPRTQGRPQPEYPAEGYGAYRLLGRLPGEAPWWRRRLLDWLLGRPAWLLYLGITCRNGFVRWVEHSDTKSWAGDVTHTEAIAGEHWATLNDTVVDDATGLPYLVFDAAAIADDGIRPIRPGEYVDTDPEHREVHGEIREVYTLDPVRGVTPGGRIQEGARTGEKRLIQAWDGGPRPIHNIEHNEGDHATNRVRRRFPRLVALARRQAAALLALWLLLAVLLWLVGAGPGGALLAAAALLQGAQVARLALTGFPGPSRSRRRPRGHKLRQRRKRNRKRYR
jgi:hypothetical protein